MSEHKIVLKGDIIITDPCYIMNSGDGRPKLSDYISDSNIGSKLFTDFTQTEMQAYKKYESDCNTYDENAPDQWELCNYGSQMENLGFTSYIADSTIYGDWSCTTFELKEPCASIESIDDDSIKGVLGEFCADAGMVGVFLLSEVLANNPKFDYHINRTWTTTWIKDFDGVVEYVVNDDEVFIVGTGNINFITKQTGL